MERSVSLDLKQVSIKCRSKKELNDLLVSDCGIYLSPIQFANSSYVRGIVTGEIKYEKAKEVKIISVPHIKSLNIESILIFAKDNFDLNLYLPKYRKQRMPDRDWLCNLIHTKLKEKFEVWISTKMKERAKMIVMKKNFQVNVIPEFSDAILKSNRVSGWYTKLLNALVVNGRSHLLLRPQNKRRKLEEESKEIIATRDSSESEKNELYSQVDNLKAKVNEFRMLYLENLNYKKQVENLMKKGAYTENNEEKTYF